YNPSRVAIFLGNAYLLVCLLLCHNQNLQILSRDFLIESRLEGKCKSPQGENNSAAGYSYKAPSKRVNPHIVSLSPLGSSEMPGN
ncbi:MAG: hypothetical protein IJU76_01035, partial [Desulfovibrionaceae bacterium]|nr:hypothetical protein [Desulfovibrionaceae bacterium]